MMQYEGVIAGMVENGLKHTTPKYSQNKIWAVKNLGNNVRTSVFGARKHLQTMFLLKIDSLKKNTT